MPQMTLYAPDITCDHCIATIQKTSTGIEGVRFIGGDPDTRSFRLEVPSGAALDALAVALADEGYPLGGPDDAPTGGGMPAMAGHGASVTMLPMAGAAKPKFVPTYTPKPSAAGADIVYSCPCGSTTEVFHYDRSKAEQALDACCNHQVLIAPDAAERLRALDGYEVINVQTVTMPWGQPMEAAMAVRP